MRLKLRLAAGWEQPTFYTPNTTRGYRAIPVSLIDLLVFVSDTAPSANGLPCRQNYFHNYFTDAISTTKRYFTSLFSSRSYASLIPWMGISSMSAVIPC